MSEKFTKGPWTSKRGGKFLDSGGWAADNDKYSSVASVPIKAGRKVIALVVDGANSWDSELTELKGNAALLTAAPHLYLALKSLVNSLPFNKDWLDPDIERLAKDALAKASAA